MSLGTVPGAGAVCSIVGRKLAAVVRVISAPPARLRMAIHALTPAANATAVSQSGARPALDRSAVRNGSITRLSIWRAMCFALRPCILPRPVREIAKVTWRFQWLRSAKFGTAIAVLVLVVLGTLR